MKVVYNTPDEKEIKQYRSKEHQHQEDHQDFFNAVFAQYIRYMYREKNQYEQYRPDNRHGSADIKRERPHRKCPAPLPDPLCNDPELLPVAVVYNERYECDYEHDKRADPCDHSRERYGAFHWRLPDVADAAESVFKGLAEEV